MSEFSSPGGRFDKNVDHAAHWRCGRFALPLARPLVMGIVNVTPDSFSDGGCYASTAAAVAHARQLIAEGSDLLDVGGESTRPGAPAVDEAEELARVIPVVEALTDCGVPVSVDTSKPAVMRAALAAGASVVNDVAALAAPGALEAVAASDCGVVLMHMQGTPRTMQAAPHYDDVVTEVAAYLAARRDALIEAGVARERIALDPGFGFGKTPEQNFRLVAQAGTFRELGCALLYGVSRKSSLGVVTGRAVDERLAASVAAALLCVERGADIVRVHDVAATVDALKIWRAVRAQQQES